MQETQAFEPRAISWSPCCLWFLFSQQVGSPQQWASNRFGLCRRRAAMDKRRSMCGVCARLFSLCFILFFFLLVWCFFCGVTATVVKALRCYPMCKLQSWLPFSRMLVKKCKSLRLETKDIYYTATAAQPGLHSFGQTRGPDSSGSSPRAS